MPKAFASRKGMGLNGLAGQETQGHRSPAENGSGKPNRQGCNSRRIRQGPLTRHLGVAEPTEIPGCNWS